MGESEKMEEEQGERESYCRGTSSGDRLLELD